jgi:hypothetical protein
LNRTPISSKDTEFDNSFDMMTNDVSTVSDSSFLLQQVPDGDNKPNATSSPDRYAISSKSLTNCSTNLPRHIIQRKQIEKINKKKFQKLGKDKENV